ncbi:MAG: substrate-binding domain-containing protein [Alphaproteobacteria bacterium]
MALKILSGGAANGLVTALTEAFTEASGMGIEGDFGAVGGMRDRVLAGEAVDMIILTRAIAESLAASGHVDAASVTDIGDVVTGVAVKDGTPLPDVSTGEALRNVLLAADAIYVPDTVKSTAGLHVAGVLQALGIADAVADRLRCFANGQTALKHMAAGDDANPVGTTQITEILNTPGVTYAGDLPAEHGLVTTYTAAICKRAALPKEARALIEILTAPAHADLRARVGFAG